MPSLFHSDENLETYSQNVAWSEVEIRLIYLLEQGIPKNTRQLLETEQSYVVHHPSHNSFWLFRPMRILKYSRPWKLNSGIYLNCRWGKFENIKCFFVVQWPKFFHNELWNKCEIFLFYIKNVLLFLKHSTLIV